MLPCLGAAGVPDKLKALRVYGRLQTEGAADKVPAVPQATEVGHFTFLGASRNRNERLPALEISAWL